MELRDKVAIVTGSGRGIGEGIAIRLAKKGTISVVMEWRWQGVPFFIRAGKCLPETCTEIFARFRKPPSPIKSEALLPNYLRFRISPGVVLAIGTTVMAPGEEMVGRSAEMLASHQPSPSEMEAYERVLSDAMLGDSTLYAREDYVEEAWRVVDPVLKMTAQCFRTKRIPGDRPKARQNSRPPGAGTTPPPQAQQGISVAA